MPHIIIKGKINFESIHMDFNKEVVHNNNSIIRFEDSLINHSKDLILINTVVIENNVSLKYYIQLMKKENQITLRLDPLTDPKNKTNYVKISIAKVAKNIFLKNKDSDISITKTNLQDFLEFN
ncbi:MAG: hypothetical protein M3Z01_05515 [Thermoproteota archaeon]|nr:hypothetical protein [Thermoproteota archaeon]